MVNISVAVLAGGNSTRMGQNKALLSLNGQPIIQHVLTAVSHIQPSDVFVITNTPDEYEAFDYRNVPDTYPGHGAISGIVSALHYSQTDYVLVVACDMPLIQSALLELLVKQIDNGGDYQAIVPVVDGYPQGVCAIYHTSIQSKFIHALESGQRKLKHVIESLDSVCYVDDSMWKLVDPQGLSFINLNTPDDFEAVRAHFD